MTILLKNLISELNNTLNKEDEIPADNISTNVPSTENNFERKCPKCGKSLAYKTKYTYLDAKKYNKLCKDCTNKERIGFKVPRIHFPSKVGFKSKEDWINRDR